jgi:hypothetical protein
VAKPMSHQGPHPPGVPARGQQVVCGFHRFSAKRASGAVIPIPTCQSVGSPYSVLEYQPCKKIAFRGARLLNHSKLWGFNPPNELGLVGR